jgi:hypothetical protein
MNEERFAQMMKQFDELKVIEQGIFGNEHPGQPDFRWLWAILKKA